MSLIKMEPVFQSIGTARLRITNDGEGVTTLAAGYGCPLRCRYCLNPQCFMLHAAFRKYTVQELLDEVRIDDLYFQATGGGVVFGGGEPLLQAEFIHAFCKACPPQWRMGLESSLAVRTELLRKVLPDIDDYLIDIKDMNPEIYRAYTGADNAQVMQNLKLLASEADPDRVRIRIPLIEGFNTEEDRRKSRDILESMGFYRFDLFSYDIPAASEKARRVRKDLEKH